MLRRSIEFAVGQHIRKKTSGGGTWQIMALRKDQGGVVNIEMFNVNDPNTRRTLSQYALSDSTQFEIVT